MNKQSFRFYWRGIKIEAVYTRFKQSVIAHLEVRSIKPEWKRQEEAARQFSLF